MSVSSPGEDVVAGTQVDPSTEAGASLDATAAGSSAAGEQGDAPELDSYLDVVNATAAKHEGDGQEQTPGSDGVKEGSEAEGEKKPEAKEEEEAPPPFHTHPRWKQMVTQRREAQARAAELQEKLSAYERDDSPVKQAASRFQAIQGFMQENGIAPDFLKGALEVGALANQDPRRALERLMPLVQTLQRAAGEVLPDDLAQEVRMGAMPMQRAQEISRLRAQQQFSEHRSVQVRQQEVMRQTQQASTEISRWENDWKSSDPDYATLQPRVLERMENEFFRRERSGHPPMTSAELVQLAETIRDDERKRLSALRPKNPIRTASGAPARPTTVAEPTSVLDIVQRRMDLG